MRYAIAVIALLAALGWRNANLTFLFGTPPNLVPLNAIPDGTHFVSEGYGPNGAVFCALSQGAQSFSAPP